MIMRKTLTAWIIYVRCLFSQAPVRDVLASGVPRRRAGHLPAVRLVQQQFHC